jgi:Zn-dependent protease with chaperone function
MDPNAFFCGLFRGRLVIHEGFLKGGKWTNEDLDAVLAHEIGHKFNGDIFLVMLSMTIILAIEFIGRALIRFGEWTIHKGGSGKDGWKVALFGLGVIITGFVFAVLVTFITGLAKMAVMRNRELMADRLGIAMTQDPLGMATLFRKFSECPPAPERLAKNELRASLFMRPVREKFSKDALASTFDGVVASHPSNETRYRHATTLIPGQ